MIVIIGFGEAGRSFGGMIAHGGAVRAFDRLDKRVQCAVAGVAWAPTLADALSNADVVFSLVTADQALAVAQTSAPLLPPGALYLDMNSVAPDTKRAAADAMRSVGKDYLDVAVMAPVMPSTAQVPLLLSGPKADAGGEVLMRAGFTNVRSAGPHVGRASAVKMIRSVMVKGIEALTAEMMLAARAEGVEEDVLASLGPQWPERARYNLERMATHGARRAVEMEEAVKTLTALGVDPVMTRGTVLRQRAMASSVSERAS